jgi:hypothetical protein
VVEARPDRAESGRTSVLVNPVVSPALGATARFAVVRRLAWLHDVVDRGLDGTGVAAS